MKIFIWVGHPRGNSLSHGLADAYEAGASEKGAEIRRMNLHDMAFDPDLTFGYQQRKDLESCLEEWRENILWADHLCWVYPQWWGGMPAKMKGVLDRAFLPGFAMNYHETGSLWDKLLTGRSADVLFTADAPPIYDILVNGNPTKQQVKKMVLGFAGIKPVRVLQMGPIKSAKDDTIAKWLKAAHRRGQDAAARTPKTR